jgi:glutamine synthetase
MLELLGMIGGGVFRLLPEVLKALEEAHYFLTVGDVFTPDLIETWIDFKYEHEILPVQLRPTPHEFELYYDI